MQSTCEVLRGSASDSAADRWQNFEQFWFKKFGSGSARIGAEGSGADTLGQGFGPKCFGADNWKNLDVDMGCHVVEGSGGERRTLQEGSGTKIWRGTGIAREFILYVNGVVCQNVAAKTTHVWTHSLRVTCNRFSAVDFSLTAKIATRF